MCYKNVFAEKSVEKTHNNLLTKWRRAGVIVNRGSDRASHWTLAEKKSWFAEKLQRKNGY